MKPCLRGRGFEVLEGIVIMAGKKNILILGNSHLVVFKFRRELIKRLIEDGHDVTVCFPNGPFGEGEQTSKEYGCKFIENHIDRRGTNPFKDLLIIKDYLSIFRMVKPDIVLAYTVKPDIYGGIACRIMNIPFIPNITGLGKGLDEGGFVQKMTVFLYKVAIKKASCVFFQNNDDRLFFDKHHIVYQKGVVLPGSGVNLTEFSPLPYPTESEPIKFIYVARVMKAKGIEQFFEAAHTIRKIYPEVEFHICGFCEENYKDVLEEKVKNGDVIYHGLVDDVRVYERNCHAVVLPSFHPEGISNVLLEGAAVARPLITTDQAGCSPTVDNNVSGYIVKQKDSADLIDKLCCFINLPYEEKKRMGMMGRKKVEKQFDRNIVVKQYIEVIERINGSD